MYIGMFRDGGSGGGAYAASQTTLLYTKRLNKTEALIFVLLCLFPKATFQIFIAYKVPHGISVLLELALRFRLLLVEKLNVNEQAEITALESIPYMTVSHSYKFRQYKQK